MIDIEQIGQGVWHVKKFFPDNVWEEICSSILNLDDNLYNHRFEPMRYRMDVYKTLRDTPLGKQLLNYSNASQATVSKITGNNNLHQSTGTTLWRDFEGYYCGWHPDDYTRLPTAQIYVAGEEDQGTSFKINGVDVRIPFKPNSGYLMDNQFQPVHGMLTTIRQQIRQSIYLIY